MTHYKNYSFLLLSDTTSSNTNMIKNCLENLGCKIILSHNSENYQTVITNRQISGILIDFKISGNSCINICKDLKSRTKNNAIPLIIYNVIDDDDVIASLTDMDLIDIFMQNLNEKELTHRLKVMLKLISSMMNLKHKKDYIKCIENTSDLLVVKMNSNFRFSEWNRTFKNFIGGKQSDLAKIYFDHLVHPENKKQIMSALSQILKNQNRISETFLMKSADGYRPTEWTFMASGHSIMASGQDVSNNRHNAEQQLISNSILKESESICQYTFWIFNPETNVIFFNRSMDFLNNTRRLKLDDFIRTFIKSDRKRLSDAFSGLRDQKENFDISCKQ